jgi:hypothetical protein
MSESLQYDADFLTRTEAVSQMLSGVVAAMVETYLAQIRLFSGLRWEPG